MKTGRCNFGVACKFHHPQPSRITMPASAFYPLVQTPSVPSPMSSWQVVQPLLPGSYVQGPHGHMMVSPGMFQISSWSPYLVSRTLPKKRTYFFHLYNSYKELYAPWVESMRTVLIQIVDLLGPTSDEHASKVIMIERSKPSFVCPWLPFPSD